MVRYFHPWGIFSVDMFYKCSIINTTFVEKETVMKLTEAEWQIMNVLWQDSPATTRQIVDRLRDDVDWAYTTISTMLARLAGKKVVRETKKGNTITYEPLLTQDNARRTALKSLMNQAFDGAFGPLMHFLVEEEKLAPAQKKKLLGSLQKVRPQKKGSKK